MSVGRGEIERLVQQVLAQTDPKVYLDIDPVTVEGKRLFRIAVPPGDGPHRAADRAFRRSGRVTVAMTRDEQILLLISWPASRPTPWGSRAG